MFKYSYFIVLCILFIVSFNIDSYSSTNDTAKIIISTSMRTCNFWGCSEITIGKVIESSNKKYLGTMIRLRELAGERNDTVIIHKPYETWRIR